MRSTVFASVDGSSETHPGDELEVGVRRRTPALVATVSKPLIGLVEADEGRERDVVRHHPIEEKVELACAEVLLPRRESWW